MEFSQAIKLMIYKDKKTESVANGCFCFNMYSVGEMNCFCYAVEWVQSSVDITNTQKVTNEHVYSDLPRLINRIVRKLSVC